jgi:DNA-binding NtrC family response regulator
MADIRILLVDDDGVVRSSLGKILDQYGFAVTTASNVSEALRQIGLKKFDGRERNAPLQPQSRNHVIECFS